MGSILKSALLLAAIVMSGMAAAADEPHPYASAKVGDFVVYDVESKFGGQSTKMEMRQEIVKKDENTATLKASMSMNGNAMPGSETVINLKEKYDPNGPTPAGIERNIKEIGKGEDTVTAGGKSVKATWVENEVAMKMQGGIEMKTKTKVWTSKEIPMGGLVKMESVMDQGTSTMVLKEFGSK